MFILDINQGNKSRHKLKATVNECILFNLVYFFGGRIPSDRTPTLIRKLTTVC